MNRIIPKISLSLIAINKGKFDLDEVSRLISDGGVDLIHCDISIHNDLLVQDLVKLKSHIQLPLDLHISSLEMLSTLDALTLSPHDLLCVHVEDIHQIDDLLQIRSQVPSKLGLAIKVETAIEALFPMLEYIDYVLFMAAEPGVSGQSFNKEVLLKIEKFQSLYPNVPIHVDGGINHLTAAALNKLHVDVLVSGSYILEETESTGQIMNLFGKDLLVPVKEIMRSGTSLPKAKSSATLVEIAQEIEAKRVGSVCIVDSSNKLVGMLTDGDLRRAIIEGNDMSLTRASQVMQRAPFTTTTDTSLFVLLRQIESYNKTFFTVPIVENDGQCVGLLCLHDIFFNQQSPWRIYDYSS